MSDFFTKDFLDWLATRLDKDAEEKAAIASNPFMEAFRQALQSHRDQELIQAAYGYQQVIQLGDPRSEKHFVAIALNNLAWIFLTCKTLYNKEEALRLAFRANQFRDEMDPETLHTLAECYFQKGDYEKALATLKKAIEQCEDFVYKQKYLLPREKAFQRYVTER
ncbi:MAG: tetratricopeptide repeat protein [Planctomycetota bacterium]